MDKTKENQLPVKNSNRQMTLANDNGIGKFLEGNITAYVPIDPQLLDPKKEYAICRLWGNCMDSDLSPLRIKDGDYLVFHMVKTTSDFDVIMHVKQVVCLWLNDGRRITKQLMFYDGTNRVIKVRQVNPEESFYIHLSMVRAMFVVDMALSPNYVEKNRIQVKK